MNVDGLRFSDDLYMKALTQNGYNLPDSIVMAINAGVDIIMLSVSSFNNYIPFLVDTYNTDEFFYKRIQESLTKLISWKIKYGLLIYEYTEDYENNIVGVVEIPTIQSYDE